MRTPAIRRPNSESAAGKGGILKTTDGGKTWNPLGYSAPGASLTRDVRIRALAMLREPGHDGWELWAGSYKKGAYRRPKDAGSCWDVPCWDLALREGKTIVGAIAASSVGSPYLGTESGIYHSDEESPFYWVQASSGLPGYGSVLIHTFARDEKRDLLWAGTTQGVYMSPDRGRTWAQWNTGFPGALRPVYALALSGTTLFAGTGSGVWMRTGSDPWTGTGFGIPVKAQVRALAIDPVFRSTIYAGTDQGVYRCTNGGAVEPTPTWTRIDSSVPGGFVRALAVVSGRPPAGPGATPPLTFSSTVYVGYSSGVYATSDGGAHWTEMNEGLTSRDVHALAIDPSVPWKLYAGTEAGVFEYESELVLPRQPVPVP